MEFARKLATLMFNKDAIASTMFASLGNMYPEAATETKYKAAYQIVDTEGVLDIYINEFALFLDENFSKEELGDMIVFIQNPLMKKLSDLTPCYMEAAHRASIKVAEMTDHVRQVFERQYAQDCANKQAPPS